MVRFCVLSTLIVVVASGASRSDDLSNLQEVLKATGVKQAEIAQRLMSIALDEKRDGEGRVQAFVFLSQMHRSDVAHFLLKNLPIKVNKTSFARDDDREKERPARWAMHNTGWLIIPHILDYLEKQKIGENDLKDIAIVFDRICTKDVAVAILKVKRERAPEPLAANIDAILTALK